MEQQYLWSAKTEMSELKEYTQTNKLFCKQHWGGGHMVNTSKCSVFAYTYNALKCSSSVILTSQNNPQNYPSLREHGLVHHLRLI